jgi:tetratricopeptide (TPR) repeat protein
MTRRWALFGWALLAASVACAHPSATDRARLLAREHRVADAIALLGDRLRDDPDDLAARRLLVRVLASQGDMAAARAEVAELSRRLPDGDPGAYIELGHAFELGHRYDEALEAYDRAASVAPTSPEGPREGGMRSARWGEAEVARPRLEEAVRRGAGDAETWHALGLVRSQLRDLDGAEQAYRAGARADPSGSACWLGLATLAVMRGDGQRALDAYERVLALHPRSAPAELGRAWALAKLGRTAESRSALDRAAEMGAPPENIARQRFALTHGGAAHPLDWSSDDRGSGGADGGAGAGGPAPVE